MKRYNSLYSTETLYIGGLLQRQTLIDLDRYLEFVFGDEDFIEMSKGSREQYLEFYSRLCRDIGVKDRETVKAWRAEEEGRLCCEFGICDQPARHHIYGRDGFTQVLCVSHSNDLLERFTYTENPTVGQFLDTGLTFADID